MTNTLVGEVYAKIIEEVCTASRTDFEEFGIAPTTLQEMQQEWQQKISGRQVASMPWEPKPIKETPAPPSTTQSNTPSNGVQPSNYSNFEAPSTKPASNGSYVKTESGTENQMNTMPNGYPQAGAPPPPQGGAARAQQLLQQQFGPAASASLTAMQQQRGGLALPGQQPQAKPQGLQLPPPGASQAQQQYAAQQRQQAMMQQQQYQQQQAQPRVKVENESPQLPQGNFQPQANYNQTDGADERDAFGQWQTMLAERRARAQQAERMMRDHIQSLAAELEGGLMVPLDEQPSLKLNRKRKARVDTINNPTTSSSTQPIIPQLDGEVDEPDIKDEDDENAINSDLDDSDEEGKGELGEDDEDSPDNILCTYDKVQRVKNKWKCTLKDGVMIVNGKEWVFHKGMGEFEW